MTTNAKSPERAQELENIIKYSLSLQRELENVKCSEIRLEKYGKAKDQLNLAVEELNVKEYERELTLAYERWHLLR